MKSDPCRHPRTAVFRRPFSGGFHLAQCCLDCGANVRGSGVWVPRGELPPDTDVTSLPEMPAAAPDPQPGLFDSLE